MRVKTTYFPVEELWGWAIWEGDSFVHAYVGPLYVFESSARQAGLDWIIEANKMLDIVNSPDKR